MRAKRDALADAKKKSEEARIKKMKDLYLKKMEAEAKKREEAEAIVLKLESEEERLIELLKSQQGEQRNAYEKLQNTIVKEEE